jgi:hypothetical protein
VTYVIGLRNTRTVKAHTISRRVNEIVLNEHTYGSAIQTFGSFQLSGIGDVGFVEYRWQRPIHGEDSTHLPQFGKALIKLKE